MGSIARRSSDSWTLIVSGRSGHSSGVMHPDYGANYELARIIDAFRRELPEDKLTYNVGMIGGGATAEMDSGTDPPQRDRQDQYHRRDRGRSRRSARAVAGPDRADQGEDAGDRRQVAAGHDGADQLRQRRLSADGADRGQPRSPRPPQPGQRRHGPGADGRARPDGPRRRRHQLRRQRTWTDSSASARRARAAMRPANPSTSRRSPARRSAPPS